MVQIVHYKTKWGIFLLTKCRWVISRIEAIHVFVHIFIQWYTILPGIFVTIIGTWIRLICGRLCNFGDQKLVVIYSEFKIIMFILPTRLSIFFQSIPPIFSSNFAKCGNSFCPIEGEFDCWTVPAFAASVNYSKWKSMNILHLKWIFSEFKNDYQLIFQPFSNQCHPCVQVVGRHVLHQNLCRQCLFFGSLNRRRMKFHVHVHGLNAQILLDFPDWKKLFNEQWKSLNWTSFCVNEW